MKVTSFSKDTNMLTFIHFILSVLFDSNGTTWASNDLKAKLCDQWYYKLGCFFKENYKKMTINVFLAFIVAFKVIYKIVNLQTTLCML